jgi:hypothetical protein
MFTKKKKKKIGKGILKIGEVTGKLLEKHESRTPIFRPHKFTITLKN